MVVLQEGSPISTEEPISHLHRGTLELCQNDHRVLGHLPDQGPPPIAQFGRVASSRKSLGGSKVLVPFPRSVVSTILSWSSMEIPLTSWLG